MLCSVVVASDISLTRLDACIIVSSIVVFRLLSGIFRSVMLATLKHASMSFSEFCISYFFCVAHLQ